MKAGIWRVVVTSTLMILLTMAGVSFSRSGRISAAEPTICQTSESPTAGSVRLVPRLDQQFLSNLPMSFALPTRDDELGARLLAEYGAALVAGDGIITAPRVIFTDEQEVARFQRKLETSDGAYRLQSAAARALAAAQQEAKAKGFSISPSDVDAAARDFQHTVKLWRSRVDPALKHWVGKGRISRQTAAWLRSLPPHEQTVQIMRLEEDGLFFSSGFGKPILSSVAPPGASQHLALLAFDVREHRNGRVRKILEEHGWYQTVLGDAPHFTYLGFPKSRLESRGLSMTRDGEREYWIPRRAPNGVGITSRAMGDAQGALPSLGYKSGLESVEVFGHSAKGRCLIAYVLGDGLNVTMIFGGFHQDEPASTAMVKAVRLYLAAHPREWQGSKVVLVPQTNPDGALLHQRTNANGVDLNRNFPGTWTWISLGSRYNPGPEPTSEPETRAVMRLVEKYAPSKIISIHQPYHCLNWDGETGRALAEEMSLYNGYPTNQDIGYPTPGSFGAYCATKGIAVVTLEMPSVPFAACWRQNKEAMLAAIRMKVPPTDRPQIQMLAANAPGNKLP